VAEPPMKVLAVSSFWHPRGGDTTCLFGMVDLLGRAGHEVVPFAMRHPDNLPSVWETRWPPWLEVVGAPRAAQLRRLPEAIWSRRAADALVSLLRDVRPDVAHLHHVHRHLTPSVLGPLRAAGVPVVWTVHDYELVCPNAHLYVDGAACERCRGHRYHEAIRHRCRRGDRWQSVSVAVEKWLHAAAGIWSKVDRFLCPSRFLLERLRAFGVPAERLRHHPNFVPERPAAEGVGEGVLYAGRLAPEKGVEDLVRAARELPDVRFTLIGDGPLRASLTAQAPANVRLLGHVPPAAVPGHIAAARIVVVPSSWPENDPYAVLEAQMIGRPVVACAVGGVPEQIRDGVDGLLVPPHAPGALARSLGALAADSGRCAELGSLACARVRKDRSAVAWLTALEETYAELVS